MANVMKRTISDIYVEYMRDYYEEILFHRGIPDPRDGLLEVHRRILFGANAKHCDANKPHVKSVKIVSAALELHPHSDTACYLAACLLSQDWKQQLILIDSHGANGAIYGDEPAKMRYLEMKKHKYAELYMLDEFKYDCVDMKDSFDMSSKEPVVLPAKLPFYIINGAFGISGGYAVSVPTHNPIEVIDELIKYLDNRNHKVYLVPDFPTGGVICNDENLRKAYSTGRSNFIMRGLVEKDEKNHELIIRELPYMTNLMAFEKQVKELSQKRKDAKKKEIPPVIPGIKNTRNASEKNKVEFIIEVKRDYTLDQVLEALYKNSSLQMTNPFIMLGVIDDKFIEFKNIEEFFETWINFRIETIKRIKLNSVRKWNYRVHIIEGLLKILNPKIIDKVISDIKKCKDTKNVLSMLEEKYDLSIKQAESVANLQLYRLTAISLTEIANEKKNLEEKIDGELKYLKDKKEIENLIIQDLKDTKLNLVSSKKYERKTKIIETIQTADDNIELIPDVEFGIMVTSDGFVKKRQPIKTQKRNGKGITIGKMKDGDYIVNISNMNERDTMWIFTETGKVYDFKVRDLNETGNNLGTNIRSHINNEKIVSVLKVPYTLNNPEEYFIITATKGNRVKMTNLSDFNIRKGGILAHDTKSKDDQLIGALLIHKDEEKEIMFANSLGRVIIISSKDIPVSSRNTIGVIAFSNDLTNEGGYLASFDYKRDDSTHVITITENGLGKLTEIEEYYSTDKNGNKSLQSRGIKGMIGAKLKDNDKVVNCKFCNLEEQVTIVSSQNMISLEMKDISIYKRTTFGMKLMNLNEGDSIIDITIP